jgi:hypothetical protein
MINPRYAKPQKSPTKNADVCHPAPSDKRKYIGDIGRILVARHGKKKYYNPREVKDAHKRSPWNGGIDFSCWAMSTYSSHDDFDTYHQETGEVCDYAEMKSTMLEGISLSDSTHLSEIPDIDLDASWLEFGDVFGAVLEGIGEFFSAIADGLS